MTANERDLDTYDSYLYHTGRAVFYGICGMFVLLAAIITISRLLKSETLAVVGGIALFGSPLFLEQRYRGLFTRKARLEFDQYKLVVKEYTRDQDVVKNTMTFPWSSIKAYNFYFTQNDYTCLTLYLKHGPRQGFILKDDKDVDRALDERSVASLFLYFARQYSAENPGANSISFRPAFFTTRVGTILLYLVLALNVGVVIMHIVLRTMPTTLFVSLPLLFGIFGRRVLNKRLYEKIQKAPLRSPELQRSK